jgi:alkylation response protein AidB-like acyl-CoA dehydrogenase
MSWVTTAGHADFYVVGAPDPDFEPVNMHEKHEASSKTAFFLVMRNEVRATVDGYRGLLGMRGNHSGPAVCETIIAPDRLLTGRNWKTSDRKAGGGGDDFLPIFLLYKCAAFLGIGTGAIDLAKKHVLNKIHADTGHRIADYSTIQDYFGENISRVNVCRWAMNSICQRLDIVTQKNNWSLHVSDPGFQPRAAYMSETLQLKVNSDKLDMNTFYFQFDFIRNKQNVFFCLFFFLHNLF